MNENIIEKEDYTEPCCPLKSPNHKESIPVRRVIDKLDEYLSRNDYTSAEKHLKYWLTEAQFSGDEKGEFTVLNEQVGLYRKLADESKALCAIDRLLELIRDDKNISAATAYINIATAYKSFGKAADALPLYEKARSVYEEFLDSSDERLGGLYNNMALTLTDLEEYSFAKELYLKALQIMKNAKDGECEMAITCCNLADLTEKESGIENGEKQINEYLEKAFSLLNCKNITYDGHYAFVCEKCAPTFGYYGYFSYENELEKRVKAIYERN